MLLPSPRPIILVLRFSDTTRGFLTKEKAYLGTENCLIIMSKSELISWIWAGECRKIVVQERSRFQMILGLYNILAVVRGQVATA